METIREVLVKLKIQLDRQKIAAPDISAALSGAKQLESQYNAVAEAAKRAAQVGNSIPSQMAAKGKSTGVDSALDAKSAAIAKAAAEERKFKEQAEKYDEQMAQRRQKAADQSRLAAEKELAEKNKFLAQAAAQAEKQLAADEKRVAKAEAIAQQRAKVQSGPQDAIRVQSQAVAVTQQSSQAYMQAGDAAKMAGEGLFTMVRGIALLNVASDEELRKTVEKIAYYQGLFDIYKGGFDLIKGTAIATRALASATTVGASAEAAYAAAAASNTAILSPRALAMWKNVAANNASSTTNAYNTLTYTANTGAVYLNGVALTKLQYIMISTRSVAASMWAFLTGPIGIALTAVGVIGYAAWNHISEGIEETRDAAERARKKMVEGLLDIAGAAKRAESAELSLSRAIKSREEYSRSSSTSSAQFAVRMDGVVAGPGNSDHMTELQRARYNAANQDDVFQQKQREILKEQERARTDFARSALSMVGRNSADASSFANGDAGYDRLRKQVADRAGQSNVIKSLQVSNAYGAAEANPANREALLKIAQNLEAQHTAELNKQKEAQIILTTETQRRQDIAKTQLQTLTEQRNTVQGMVASQRQYLEANRQAQKDEENRGKSLAQRFGELKTYEQEVIRSISEKVKTGGVESLNDSERETLKSTGFADSVLSKFNLKRGQAAGFDQIAANLGTFKPGTTDAAEGQGANETRMEFLKRQEQESRALIAEQEQKLSQLIKDQYDAREKVIAGIEELSNLEPVAAAIDKAIVKFKQQVDALNQRIEKLLADQKTGQLGSRTT